MTPSESNLHIGSDPRGLAACIALRAELGKLSHPARPDLDWPHVEQLCLALFQENGVELQSAAAYTLARTHLHGLAGLEEGLALIRAQLQADWPRFWPPALPARLEILGWLFSQLQPQLRRIDGIEGDLSLIARIQDHLQALDAVLVREVALPLAPLQALQGQLERLAMRLEREHDGKATLEAAPEVAREPEKEQTKAPAAYQRLVYVVKEPVAMTPVGEAKRSTPSRDWRSLAIPALLAANALLLLVWLFH